MSEWLAWITSWSPFPFTAQPSAPPEALSDTASFAAYAGREAPVSEADSFEFSAADRTE